MEEHVNDRAEVEVEPEDIWKKNSKCSSDTMAGSRL